MDKCEHDRRTEVKKELLMFPIRYKKQEEADKFCFVYPEGYKVNMCVIVFDLGLDRDAVYKEYNMRYIGFDNFKVKEEDADRFVRYINSRALLRKV